MQQGGHLALTLPCRVGPTRKDGRGERCPRLPLWNRTGGPVIRVGAGCGWPLFVSRYILCASGSSAGVTLSELLMKTYQAVCGSCGVSFTTRHFYTLYCSNRCRQTARRLRVQLHRAKVMPKLLVAQGLEVRSWQGHAIQRRQADGFFNATAMCQACGKRWNHYQENAATQAYIQALAAVAGIPATDLILLRQGGTPSEQGTWIHPRLAIDLARWLSPQFAVWMDGWFLESMGSQPQPKPQQLHLAPASPATELLEDLPSWDLPSDLANWHAALDTLEESLDLEVKARASMIRGQLLLAEAGLERLAG